MIRCDHCKEIQEDSTSYIKLMDKYPKETIICKKCMNYWRKELELEKEEEKWEE